MQSARIERSDFEMIHSDTSLWDTKKSDRRLDIRDEPGPISVQIAGYDARDDGELLEQTRNEEQISSTST